MGRYEHLPIYKSAYVLSREIYRTQGKLPKGLKFGLGSMLFESSVRCIRGIVFANGSKNKSRALDEVALEIEVMWTYLRLLYDLKGITKGEFEILSQRLADMSPQVTAWSKWDKSKLINPTAK